MRGLDQNGPGKDGENLETLWNCLTAHADGQFHAAEESSLRWLLKSMNGPSEDAETIRRYPLTWTILDCVFSRIPLFSLAKSLADRRFMTVLQQTAKDISKPTDENGPTASSKRKRSSTKRYAVGDLRVLEGCVYTAQAVFQAIQSLLRRLENTTTLSSHDRIGAEHIRSLFCTSATEATALVSPLLVICDLLLASEIHDEIDGCEDWINTLSTVWYLHMQSSEDTVEVAAYLFNASAILLSRLEGFSGKQRGEIYGPLRTRWSVDLQKFLHRSLILPARAAFLNRQDFEAVTRALDVSKGMVEISTPALYFLASGAFDLLAKHDLRRGNSEWMKKLFQAVELAIHERPDRNILMRTILDQAVQRSMPVGIEDLRSVCRSYALSANETDWELVARIAKCEPAVFQTSQEGADLLNEVCRRSIETKNEDSYQAITTIIGAIIQGFRTARDIPGFLKLWFAQVCVVEDKALRSAWLDVGRKDSPGDPLDSLIEKEMSPHQLLEVVKWVEAQPTHPQALCMFSQTIAEGVRSEPYVDAVGRRLFDLLLPVKTTSSPATALKWRVVSKTISWGPASEISATWSPVKDQLSKILQKAPIKTAETFEAFKCCCQAWVSMSSDDEQIIETAAMVGLFTDRLAAEIANADVLGEPKLSSCLEPDASFEFEDDFAYQNYLAWYIRGSSRLTRLYANTKGGLPKVLQDAISTQKSQIEGLRTFWNAMLQNDVNLNDTKLAKDLADRLIDSLAESEKEKHWPAERGVTSIRLLSSIPVETLSRPQREEIMVILARRRAKMLKSPKHVSPEGWKLVLGLATKMMGRSTFYEGMGFSDLVEVADAMSNLSFDTTFNDETLLELIERFFLMASTTIRQMAEHIEERSIKYLTGSLDFITLCEARVEKNEDAMMPPFHITLLKALATELTRSPNCRSHPELSSLPPHAKQVLAKCVTSAMGTLMGNKKIFSNHDSAVDLALFAVVDAASSADDLTEVAYKSSTVRKFENRSRDAMKLGDIRGWKTQTFLMNYMPGELEASRPTTFDGLDKLPSRLRGFLLKAHVESVTRLMTTDTKVGYLKDVINELHHGSETDGQILAVQQIINQLIGVYSRNFSATSRLTMADSTDLHGKGDGFDLAAAHGELTSALMSAKTSVNFIRICHILHNLLEKKPQAMSQWNVEMTLSTICALTSNTHEHTNASFTWMCKLVEVIIKKHRLRLEGHYHLLLATMQSLLRNLIIDQPQKLSGAEDSLAHMYARLITLVCEPTAGAVSRAQQHSALDSATDAAKRSAGRHMYLVLMQYVKLQLEANVPRAAREALEPAMNSIFDITPPEGRKILNDAMDASGRAILREMFKRYTKFGKWSGV